ncbi:F-box/LRR-repeat protein 8-like [Chrysoperla carnea]|uniref:F-box/LRR-repeat protein 8-like n=1 Tax=Chrysoperla carnea TaxID=189513 RepID=UPI001D06B2E2|nr:F-box/LRR-repeat protein 8-like [Chrysoperla carnea]
MAEWDSLPELILTHILGYLPRRDRIYCGMVCRTWSRALDNPILWRHLKVYIDSDLKEPWTNILTMKFGRYIHSLDLAWSKPYMPRQWIRDRLNLIAHDSCRYFMLLTGEGVQLTCLRLTDWFFAWKFKKMTYHLSNFISTQTKLEYVSFYNANLGPPEMLKLLSSCTRSSHNSLRYVDIRSAFHEWQTAFSFPRFIRALERLQFLTVLKIDYPSLSNETLYAIGRSANNVLSFLDIRVRDSDSRGHLISEDAWHDLCSKCKNLRVGLKLINICHFEDTSYLLVRGMPLRNFSMISGFVWDQSRSRNLRATLKLLIVNFYETLVEVHLHLRNNREQLDDLLITMLKQCPLLQKLDYDGILRSMEVVRDICDLQCDPTYSKFKEIYIQPRSLNLYNHSVIQQLQSEFGYKMKSLNIDFHIEDASSVLMFY